MGWQQNYYTVKYPEKYIGDLDNVFYRSSWELDAFEFCENNKRVLKWSSEEICIPYFKPTGNGGFKPAKYWPDLYMEYMRSDGKVCKDLVEIKPHKQTNPSRSRNPKNKMFENQTFMINELKWEAARNWCKQNGMTFRVVTEKNQFK
jgi:hypothetical protein